MPDDAERGCAAARLAHAALFERLVGADLHVGGGSRLPGWTRGHVLTHLARNADGHRRMIEGAARGEMLDQYVGGVDGRSREIDEGAGRSAAELLDDLRTSATKLEAAWDATDWVGTGRRTLGGETPIRQLPFRRLREVWLHHVDLDVGTELVDLDPYYVRVELRRMEMLWAERQPMATQIPSTALSLSATDRLGWFTGRLVVAGLAPAAIF